MEGIYEMKYGDFLPGDLAREGRFTPGRTIDPPVFVWFICGDTGKKGKPERGIIVEFHGHCDSYNDRKDYAEIMSDERGLVHVASRYVFPVKGCKKPEFVMLPDDGYGCRHDWISKAKVRRSR